MRMTKPLMMLVIIQSKKNNILGFLSHLGHTPTHRWESYLGTLW